MECLSRANAKMEALVRIAILKVEWLLFDQLAPHVTQL